MLVKYRNRIFFWVGVHYYIICLKWQELRKLNDMPTYSAHWSSLESDQIISGINYANKFLYTIGEWSTITPGMLLLSTVEVISF